MRKPWCQILEKDEKVTLGTFMLSQQEHLPVVQNFTFSLKISSDFAILISLCIEFCKTISSLNPSFMNHIFKVKNVTKSTNINKEKNSWR